MADQRDRGHWSKIERPPTFAHRCTGLSTYQIKRSVANKIKIKEKTKCWEDAYHIIRDIVLGVDHVPICMSRCCKQLPFPFLPP